jgi:hypothetical protein
LPELAALRIADPPERWEELGFSVADGVCSVGGVRLELGGEGRGITAWSVDGLEHELPGLTSFTSLDAASQPAHPNGAIGLDHVVVVTRAFDHTAEALTRVGLELRRIRDAGGFRQGFRRIGPAILEIVESQGAPLGPPRFWGLVVVVADLDALKERLGDRLGNIHDAVQSGRRIATLRPAAGLSTKVAFMDPDPARAADANDGE